MTYKIVNLLRLTDLQRLNDLSGTTYKRVKEQTTFDKELEFHHISEGEYRYYKKVMEREPKGY